MIVVRAHVAWTANRPACRILGKLAELVITLNDTSGGLIDTLWNDWQVKPIGSPSMCDVITVIPDA